MCRYLVYVRVLHAFQYIFRALKFLSLNILSILRASKESNLNAYHFTLGKSHIAWRTILCLAASLTNSLPSLQSEHTQVKDDTFTSKSRSSMLQLLGLERTSVCQLHTTMKLSISLSNILQIVAHRQSF